MNLHQEIQAEQEAQIGRVKNRIASFVLDFLTTLGQDKDFYLKDLQLYVANLCQISPDSPSRILRDLKDKGIIDYDIISRRNSHYFFRGFQAADPNKLNKTVGRLGYNNYSEYLSGEHWLKFNQLYFSQHPIKCEISGSIINIELHHINYRNLGQEQFEDVVPLNHQVHLAVHYLIDKHGVRLSEAHLLMKTCFGIAKIMGGNNAQLHL